MFVNRRLDNSDPIAKTDPVIVKQIADLTSAVANLDTSAASIESALAPIKADLASATASSSGVDGTLVRRDANKDFEASKVKLWHLESAGPVLSIAGNSETQTLNIGSGTGMQTINVGNNRTGATTIKLGGGSTLFRSICHSRIQLERIS